MRGLFARAAWRMRLSGVVPLIVVVVLAGAAACTGAPRLEVPAAEAQLSPMLGRTCAVFAEIHNRGDGRDALVDARVDLPGAVAELHEIRDGRMVKAGEVDVPANGVLSLRPGGLHVMVFNLPRDAVAGTEVPLRLAFRRSGELRVPARIR